MYISILERSGIAKKKSTNKNKGGSIFDKANSHPYCFEMKKKDKKSKERKGKRLTTYVHSADYIYIWMFSKPDSMSGIVKLLYQFRVNLAQAPHIIFPDLLFLCHIL